VLMRVGTRDARQELCPNNAGATSREASAKIQDSRAIGPGANARDTGSSGSTCPIFALGRGRVGRTGLDGRDLGHPGPAPPQPLARVWLHGVPHQSGWRAAIRRGSWGRPLSWRW
jgi:hypothetical protein